jgi:4'-phosphopantetheinyl transferase
MPAPYSLDGSALSLSHSGGYAAVATSRTAVRLGVDMECARPSDTNRLARFAFSERERAQLEALPADARAERFYILWTLKEAFAKALSLSLFASLARCTFTEERGAWHASVPTANAWVAHVFRPSPSIVLSVVALLPEHVRPDDFSVSTHEWPEPAAHLWRLLATLHSTQHVT